MRRTLNQRLKLAPDADWLVSQAELSETALSTAGAEDCLFLTLRGKKDDLRTRRDASYLRLARGASSRYSMTKKKNEETQISIKRIMSLGVFKKTSSRSS